MIRAKVNPAFFRDWRAMQRRAGEKQTILAEAGWYMVRHEMPHRFSMARWPKAMFQPGRPLQDTHRLRRSFAWEVGAGRLVVGTSVPYAGVHNGQHGKVFVVRPKRAGALTIPNPKKLGVRAYRGAQARDYPNAKRRKGYRGYGIYAGPRDREPLFFLRKRARIPARPFLYWDVPILKALGDWWQTYTVGGGGHGYSRKPAKGGNPDVGARNGGRP